MKVVAKIFSMIGISLFLAFVFISGRWVLAEGKHLFYPYADTQFASGCTLEKFRKIKVGMSREDVYCLVGKPLFTFKNRSGQQIYSYTDDGKLLKKAENEGRKDYGDLAWYSLSITFSGSEEVVLVDEGWCFD